MNIPENLYYTKSHEYIKQEGDTAIVGITDFAQHQLGDIVFVELPEVGKKFSKGEKFAVVESVKAVEDIYIPISGEVIEINSNLESSPQTVNESPYDDGWLVKVKLENPNEVKELLTPEKYKEIAV